MTWSCQACTFDNDTDEATACSICGSKRKGGGGGSNNTLDLTEVPKKKKKQSNPQQRTLFGDVASIPAKIPRTKKKGTENTVQSQPNQQQTQQQRERSSKQPATKTASSSSLQKKALKQQQVIVDKSRMVSSAPYKTLKARSEEKLKSVFGLQELRKLQPVAVDAALRKKSQIIVMATGGGKSLCYQLPALVLGGVTLVISPLIALMVDQVQALLEKGVSAALVSSASGQRNNAIVMERLLGRRFGKSNNDKSALKPITLLYCTPELIQTDRFRGTLRELYQKQGLAMFAIDEAHCVSTWGHDFRAAYRKLSWLRQEFPTVPIMACTATATKKVLRDIRETLDLEDEDDVPCHLSTFNRPNIEYQVRFKDSLDVLTPGGALGDLIEFIKEQHKAHDPCSGIIYVHKREDTAFLAKQISRKNIVAAPYHAGLKDAERSSMQQDWTSGKIQIAVATVAFGMGIDLAHVRYVIHWNMAKTVEGFYQESGRGGRDGLPATSILYYSKDDASKFAFLLKKSAAAAAKKKNGADASNNNNKLQALEQMSNYCMEPTCRRQFLLNHFGESSNPKELCRKTCDYCQDPNKVSKAISSSGVVKDVMKSAANVRRHYAKSKQQWDGQWNKPHGDDNDDDNDDSSGLRWTSGDLGITSSKGSPDDDAPFRPKKRGFQKASDILSKYEKLECQDDAPAEGGFVTFKPVVIPEHLRRGMPDPLSHLAKKPKHGAKNDDDNSKQLGDRAAQLKANLAKLKAEQQAKLKALQSKLCLGGAPPPPPPASLISKKTKKKR